MNHSLLNDMATLKSILYFPNIIVSLASGTQGYKIKQQCSVQLTPDSFLENPLSHPFVHFRRTQYYNLCIENICDIQSIFQLTTFSI